MLDLLIAQALTCDPPEIFQRPLFTQQQKVNLEIYISGELKKNNGTNRVVSRQQIDSILKSQGCLSKVEGAKKEFQVWRWEGRSPNNQTRAVEAKWQGNSFLKWTNEGF